MLLYELSTGKSYFEQETPEEITQMLSSPDFKVDLRDVKKNRLRNLIGQCLQTDPKKRPSINEVLLHPYFLTTGLGLVQAFTPQLMAMESSKTFRANFMLIDCSVRENAPF